MGRCPDCGAPCHQCVSLNEFTLMRLKEPMRGKVKRLLDDVGCTTNTRGNEFINEMMQYSEVMIDRAFRIWKQGGYAFDGKDERYFLGILKHNSIGKAPVLDSTPPVAEMPPEEEIDES